MKYFLLPALLLCSGCVCFNSAHKDLLRDRSDKPPTANTGGVKEQLDGTKGDLSKIGESSQGISKSVDKAQNLTERIDEILEELDKEQQKK